MSHLLTLERHAPLSKGVHSLILWIWGNAPSFSGGWKDGQGRFQKWNFFSNRCMWGVRASSSDLLADHEAEAASVLRHRCPQLLLLLVGNIFQVQKQRAALKHSHDCKRTGQEAHTQMIGLIIYLYIFLRIPPHWYGKARTNTPREWTAGKQTRKWATKPERCPKIK